MRWRVGRWWSIKRFNGEGTGGASKGLGYLIIQFGIRIGIIFITAPGRRDATSRYVILKGRGSEEKIESANVSFRHMQLQNQFNA